VRWEAGRCGGTRRSEGEIVPVLSSRFSVLGKEF
jgi:hypothetical protein